MLAWRLTAAAAAFCLLASSTIASSADPAKTRNVSAQDKKHKVSHHARPRESAALRRRNAKHRAGRYATLHHHRKAAHLVRRLEAIRQTPAERDFSGTASYYWEGSRVASGGRFDPDGLTAAHRTLPFGTRLRVTDLISNRSVVVTVNDRGPFVSGRVLDLSRGAARVLGMTERGVTRIKASVM